MSYITSFSLFSVLPHILYLLQLSLIEFASTLSSIRKIASSFPVFISSQIIKVSQEEEMKCTLNEQEAKSPYLYRNNPLQLASQSVNALHFHLVNRAMLNSSRFLIPRPPSFFGLHTLSQATQYIPLSPSLMPQRKSR